MTYNLATERFEPSPDQGLIYTVEQAINDDYFPWGMDHVCVKVVIGCHDYPDAASHQLNVRIKISGVLARLNTYFLEMDEDSEAKGMSAISS